MLNYKNKIEAALGGVIGLAFLLFNLSFFLPFPSKGLYFIIAISGLCWVLSQPSSVPDFFRAFGILLLPLLVVQVLNVRDFDEIKQWLGLTGLVAAYALMERSAWGVERLYRIFAYTGIAVLAYASIDWLLMSGHTEAWVRYDRLFGHRIDPNNVALLMACCLAFIWLVDIEPRLNGRSAVWKLLGLVGISSAMLLAASIFQSRSSLVGFGFFMAGYMLTRRWWGLSLLGLVAVLAIGSVTDAFDILATRGLSYRPQIWSDAIHRVVDQCGVILGCGQDGYRFLHEYTHTHNLPIGIFYNDGLAGVALVGIFAGYYFYRGFALKSPWFLISLIGIGGLMTNTGWLLGPPKAFWAYFWTPIILAYIRMRQEALARYFHARRSRALVHGEQPDVNI
jgi:hypothetical protein